VGFAHAVLPKQAATAAAAILRCNGIVDAVEKCRAELFCAMTRNPLLQTTPVK
jgi:hypothetical protein